MALRLRDAKKPLPPPLLTLGAVCLLLRLPRLSRAFCTLVFLELLRLLNTRFLPEARSPALDVTSAALRPRLAAPRLIANALVLVDDPDMYDAIELSSAPLRNVLGRNVLGAP